MGPTGVRWVHMSRSFCSAFLCLIGKLGDSSVQSFLPLHSKVLVCRNYQLRLLSVPSGVEPLDATFFLFVALRPNAGHGFLILEVL
jgi:hypothetical protein